MAFVIRSERNIRFSSLNSAYPGPGEYGNKTQKPIPKHQLTSPQSIPFNTSAHRTDLVPKINNPGPGAYQISLSSFTQPNEMKQSIDNKHQINPSEFITRIGFLASSKRFTEPNHSSLDQFQKNDCKLTELLNLQYSTSSKLFEDNQGHVIKPGLNSKARSSSRVVSIPSKKMFGYDYTKEGTVYLVEDPDSSIKLTGDKNNSAGPGQYEIGTKWTRNIVKWGSNSNQKIGGSHLTNKSLSSFQYSEFINRDDTRKSTKHHQSQIQQKQHQLGVTQMQERRQHYLNLLMKNRSNPLTELMKETTYEDTPGPGFYTKEFESGEMKPFKENSNNNTKAHFGGTSKRFKINTKDNSEIGPGCYFDDYSKYERLMTQTNQILKPFNQNYQQKQNKDNDCAYIRKLQKRPQKGLLGPGSYAISDNYIRKEVSKISNFGSVTERFKYENKEKENMPDPGSYFQQTSFSLQKNNVNKTKDNGSDDTIINNKKQNERMELFNTENPPVGSYSPGVISSIEYSVQSKLNPYQSQIVSFNTTDKRLKIHDNLKYKLGPGLYSLDNSAKNNEKMKQSFSPFNHKNCRLNASQHENIKTEPGPGTYSHNSQFDWKKKSFNVLFI